MGYASEAAAIEQRLGANWTTTAIAYENVEYTPSAGTPYVKIDITGANQIQASIGATTHLYRHPGIITINIFVPAGTGSRTAKGYADTIAAIFRGKQFSGITCLEASTRTVGEKDGWFIVSVSIGFHRDEIM